MNAAKVHLSEDELKLVKNANWLLTKNNIIRKVYLLFGHFATEIEDSIVDLPAEFTKTPPKISKGENYRGLPYVILDYPRLFERENIFAIRTMFWWGNFLSITLHLRGKYKEQFEPVLIKNLELLRKEDFHISVSNEEWHHHFEENNYLALKNVDESKFKNFVSGNSFCKISARISLDNWNDAEERLLHFFKVIIKTLQINFPSGETDL